MKKAVFAALIGIISFAALSFAPAASGPSIVIKKGVMKIDGENVTANWSLYNFKLALGEPDRTRDGYNKTHTYDSKKIVLFEPMTDNQPTGKVSEMQIYFQVPESVANNVTPTDGTFPGSIVIDKVKITKDLTATMMQSKLKKWTKTDSFLEHSYRMACKGMYIYFQYNDSETQLIKISIGPDKRTSSK